MDFSAIAPENRSIRYSIIIPTRGRADSLRDCLCSILLLDYPREQYEVIVVFDGDQENYSLFQSNRKYRHPSIRMIYQEPAGPAAARNLGAQLARGDFLAFTDDDCLVPIDWLLQADLVFCQKPTCMLGGEVLPSCKANVYSATNQALLKAVYDFYNADPGHARFFASCHMLMPKFAFEELGGFDSNFLTSEDRDFCERWYSRGWPLCFHPGLLVQHDQKENLSSFFRRHFGYGKGGYYYHLKRARLRRDHFQLAPPRFYVHLFFRMLKLAFRPSRYFILCLLFMSQLASLFGFMVEVLSSPLHLEKDG